MIESKVALTLVIPTYNEEKRLPGTLQLISDWMPHSCFDVEVIIVDDGSQDKTREVVDSYMGRIPKLQFLQVPHIGQLNATITGLKKSIRPLRATLEADCPVHPRTLELFLEKFPDFDVVMGSRILQDDVSSVEGKPLYRRILSSVMSRLFAILFKGGIHDPQIGFKLYHARVLDQVLPLLTLRHDGLKSAEIIVKAMAFGYRVKEVPVRYKHDDDSRCVPKGSYGIVLRAALALGELWIKSYIEYKRGDLPVCPVRFGIVLLPFWRMMTFIAPHPAGTARNSSSLMTS